MAVDKGPGALGVRKGIGKRVPRERQRKGGKKDGWIKKDGKLRAKSVSAGRTMRHKKGK